MAECVYLFLLKKKKEKRNVKQKRHFYPAYIPTEQMFAPVDSSVFQCLCPNGQQYFKAKNKRQKSRERVKNELMAFTSLEDSSIWSFISLIFCSSSSRLFRIVIRVSSIAASSWILCSSFMPSGVCNQ